MSNLRVPNWNTYDAQNAFPYTVENINSFSLAAEFPAVADWDDPKLRARLHDRLHDDVTKLLRTAEFFSESSVEQRKGADYFSVVFNDDMYDFEIRCHSSKIVLAKTGISLSTFHHWFHAAIPSVKTVFQSVLDVLGQSLNRNQPITSVLFDFGFVAHEFVERARALRNYQVLAKLVTQAPSDDGMIREMPVDPRDISRLDYKVNRWDGGDRESRRRLTYSVTAPSNRGYTGLWFNFAYGSETFKDPVSGQREWVDPAILLDEYERVYEFMWRRGVGGFMKSLLGSLDFRTTASYIP